MSGPEFYPLRVVEVTRETDEAVAVTFDVPEELAPIFAYLPGQHVTLRAMVDGHDIRRSYSICANANSGKLRVGVKRLPGGEFSGWIVESLRAGDVLEVMPPVGEFTISPDPASRRRYVAIAVGSGITPVLSLIATTLESEPGCRWTLILGNREARTVMFLEELEGLKDRYPHRFQLIHVLSREQTAISMFSGRLEPGRLAKLLDALVPANEVDEWFLCGPFEMVMGARRLLEGRGVGQAHIHDELFFAGPLDLSSLPPEPEEGEGTVVLNFTLDGRESAVRMRPETSVLDAALAVRRELPYSCKGGMCASCKAQVIEGEVRMDKNWALVAEELEAGYVLTCQSHPVSPRLTVNYDV